MSVLFDKKLSEKYYFIVLFGSNSRGVNIAWRELWENKLENKLE